MAYVNESEVIAVVHRACQRADVSLKTYTFYDSRQHQTVQFDGGVVNIPAGPVLLMTIHSEHGAKVLGVGGWDKNSPGELETRIFNLAIDWTDKPYPSV